MYVCKNNSIYIPLGAICDGIKDCPNADDEFECQFSHQSLFKCQNGTDEFINSYHVCDFVDDCLNAEDEKLCCNLQRNK